MVRTTRARSCGRRTAALSKNLENKGNPWGQNSRDRLDWTKKLGFEVNVFGADAAGELGPQVEYLLWIGCAGAFDDGANPQ